MSTVQTPSPPPSKRRRVVSPHDQVSSKASPPASPPTLPSKSSLSAGTTSLRIFSWNINGIQPFLPPTTPQITRFLTSTSKPKPPNDQPSLRANLQRWEWPHILFLQEVKVAPTDTKTPALLRRTINDPLSDEEQPISQDHLYDAHFCLPRDKYNATGFGGKVYGVATIIRQDIAPHTVVRTVDWDLEGRIQVVQLPRSKLIVINVYAVNGTTYDYRDPTSGKVVGNRHDRKRAFHSLLAQEVKAYEDKQWNVVIAGDINVSRSKLDSSPQLRTGEDHVKNRVDFEKKFITGLGMLDTFRLVHGEERKYTYRPTNKPWGTGGDRVDVILATKGLEESMKEVDILDNQAERGPSDHVPLFVELEMQRSHDGENFI